MTGSRASPWDPVSAFLTSRPKVQTESLFALLENNDVLQG
jgi:hypothetical protein